MGGKIPEREEKKMAKKIAILVLSVALICAATNVWAAVEVDLTWSDGVLQVTTVEPVPEGLEMVLVKLETVLDFPYKGLRLVPQRIIRGRWASEKVMEFPIQVEDPDLWFDFVLLILTPDEAKEVKSSRNLRDMKLLMVSVKEAHSPLCRVSPYGQTPTIWIRGVPLESNVDSEENSPEE